MDCDFDNELLTCPRCGFPAGARDWHRNCDVQPNERPESCIYRGVELRQQQCPTCNGDVRVKVFACPIKGECSISKPLDGITCCQSCADFTA